MRLQVAKELPYFQFEPAEYLTKDVSFCTLSAQGLFINICSYYWQRKCDLTKEQFLRRFNYINEFEELLKEGIIDLDNDKIIVKFLNFQYFKATEKSTVNSSNGSKGGRPKKRIETETKAKLNPIESETKGIREDKIKEDEIIKNKNNILLKKELKNIFNFKKKLLEYGFKENLVDDWLKVRKTKKATNTETAFESFIKEVETRNFDINEILKTCVTNSWSGFKYLWIDNLKNINNEKQITTKPKQFKFDVTEAIKTFTSDN